MKTLIIAILFMAAVAFGKETPMTKDEAKLDDGSTLLSIPFVEAREVCITKKNKRLYLSPISTTIYEIDWKKCVKITAEGEVET